MKVKTKVKTKKLSKKTQEITLESNISFKRSLLDTPGLSYIVYWDFAGNLSLAEGAMLSYLIDNDDFKKANGDWFELTPSYIQGKRPSWRTTPIRTALKGLVDKEYIIKKDENNGRGNYYKLNIEKITSELVEPFLVGKESKSDA